MFSFFEKFNLIFKDFFIVKNIIVTQYLYLHNLLFLRFNLLRNFNSFSSNKTVENEKKVFFLYGAKNVRELYKRSFLMIDSFKKIDIIWSQLISIRYSNNNSNIFRSYFRVFSSKQGFYFNLYNLKKNNNFKVYLLNSFLSGIKFIWFGLRFWLFPLIVFFSIIYFTLVFRGLPFNKIMFGWICILMFSYWLLSGFVFFFKKYQFGKYTTAVQRFWRRSYILFWMIEGGTFSVFLFFTLNSSQESFYMYDQISIFKTHLYSWKFFLLKIFPVVILIITTYLLLITVKWNIYSKHSFVLVFLTLFLSYLVWLEFYQFFHVLSFYGNLTWIYDLDDHSWSLELEPRRTRIVNHYVMLLFILKFWHIIFIYGFWIFFVLRCWETKRIRYPLLSANLQNFIILYIFSWVFMYPWFKFFFRKFLDMPYYWFYVNNRKFFLRIFFNDLKLFYYGFTNFYYNLNLNYLTFFRKSPFFYWKNLNNLNNFENYRKSVIKDRIVLNLFNMK